ncbi:hypothetical protein Peur_062857 [Populus x canadensis]
MSERDSSNITSSQQISPIKLFFCFGLSSHLNCRSRTKWSTTITFPVIYWGIRRTHTTVRLSNLVDWV